MADAARAAAEALLRDDHEDDEGGDDAENEEQSDPEGGSGTAVRLGWRVVGPVGGLVRDQVVALDDLGLVLDFALHASGLADGTRSQTA
jgi:hypothetical protein